MFRIEKKDTNGQFIYELTFNTWKELTMELGRRNREANSVFYGVPAVIYKGENDIGDTSTFDQVEKPITQITLTEFINAEMDSLDKFVSDGGLNV